jgi:predicted permease
MPTVIIVFIENILPILIIISAGFLLEKKFHLDIATLTKIAFYILIPVFLFVSVYTSDIDATMLLVILFVLIFMAASYLITRIGTRFIAYDTAERGVIINTVLFYNCGNMGLPITYLIFGDTPYLNHAVAVQLAVILIQGIAVQSFGLFITKNSSTSGSALKALALTLRMPTIYGAALGFLLKSVPVDLTELFFWPSLEYFYQMVMGFILMTFGIQLGKTRWSFNLKKDLFPVVLRLLASPAAALLMLKLFNFDPITSRVLFIASAMPAAANVALIAAEEKSSAEFASQIVLTTTLVSIVTLSFIIHLSSLLFPV